MYNARKTITVFNKYHSQAFTFFIIAISFGCGKRAGSSIPSFNAVLNKIDSSYNRKFYYSKEDIRYLDSAFASLKDPEATDSANRYLRTATYYGSTENKLDEAISCIDSTITVLQNHLQDQKLSSMYVFAHFAKGDIYFKTKNYDEAVRNYTAGKMILSTNLRDSCELFNYYHSMAFALYAQHKYLQAARFFRLKYLSAASCGRDPYIRFLDIQENLDNTGMGYFHAGMKDSAFYYYHAALDYINENEKNFPAAVTPDFEINRSVVYSNLAEFAYQQGDTAEAEKLFLKSIAGTRTLDAGFTKPLRLSLARLYLENNQSKKAGDILKDTSFTISESEISATAGDFYKLLSDYYLKKNQVVAANRSLLHACRIKDSLEKINWRLNSIDILREFENREQQVINRSLKADSEIKKVYLLIAFTTAVMAVIIIFLIWHNLKRKSANVKKLGFLHAEISRKNTDLQNTYNSLERSHTRNNRIIRVVAHDLKNPVSAIRALVYAMLKEERDGQNKTSLEMIQSTCTDSISLINDLLYNKRKLKDISKELVDMGRLTEQCTELFQVKAGEKNQLIKLEINYPVILLNRQRIWRVISNIVNNAIKFSPANAEITVKLKKKGGSILLSVHDNGIGIPSGLKGKIFALDPTVSRQGTAGEESYGLGLSISRKIVEEHAGQLWFESEAGKGSVFYVELPCNVN